VYYMEPGAWEVRRGDDPFRFEDDLKLKYAVWLICLLLFVAAVDNIPDPLAINPPGSHRSGISVLHVRGLSSSLEKDWTAGPNPSRLVQIFWLSLRVGFDDRPAGFSPLPLIHYATDTSPPSVS
jgi:hypothetical protein